ncbi:hypothetical protein [Phenylobacterium sp.]|uniref:hypothetical protein n=1 Tax=Phenylobacterium sp. TaxID=1871053 RepID=UPI002F93FC0E
MATVIRIYPEAGDAGIGPHLEFNLSDFGGQLPNCGDLIIKPQGQGAPGDEVWEVSTRYFDPGPGFDAGACLHVLVRSRPMSPSERALHQGLSPPLRS